MGSALTYLGSYQQAQSYRAGGQASIATAQYNAALLGVERDRELNQLSRRIGSFLSTQRAQAAKSGLSSTSKSVLALLSDTMTEFERQSTEIRNTTKQRQDSVIYEGRVAQHVANQQARAAQFRGISGALSGLTSLF